MRFGISPATRKFIDYLDMYGRFRYLEVSYHGKARDLVALDRAVWEIRRYCAPLDYYVARGGKNISMLEYELGRIERSNKKYKQFSWFNGELERIAANRKHPARSGLRWKNFYFGTRLPTKIRLSEWFKSVNSPLSLNHDLFEEVRKYVFLPKGMVDEFEELLERRKQ